MENWIWKLVNRARNGHDDILSDLANDVLLKSIRYSKYRMDWFNYSVEQRYQEDKYRTSAHDSFIDSMNIFLRYLKRSEKDIPDLSALDRKEYGDIACYISYQIALSQR